MDRFSEVKYEHSIHGKLPRSVRHLIKTGNLLENCDYLVLRRMLKPAKKDLPAIVHLSIKRKDCSKVRSWFDLQSIKNTLVGPESEGVELFPAESRKVDSADQYHLWVLADNTKAFLTSLVPINHPVTE